MRTRQLLVLAALVAPAGGCNWMKEWRERDQVRDRGVAMDPKEVTPERLVAYLNDRASRLQSIEYRSILMRVDGKDLPVPANLNGDLLCAQPRSFQLLGSGKIVSSKVIIGSNPEQFWVYVAPPQAKPVYVYASHTDFASGRARLPDDIPFEPDWVMQALGMTTFAAPPAVQYTVTPNYRDRRSVRAGSAPSGTPESYTLSWEATTPAKVPVIKEVVFSYTAEGTRPVVKKHIIRDARSNKKVIASAEVKAVETVKIGVNSNGSPVDVQYPTHMILRWEEQDFNMDLTLKDARVNQMDEQTRRNAFARPDIPGAGDPINLIRYAELRSAK